MDHFPTDVAELFLSASRFDKDNDVKRAISLYQKGLSLLVQLKESPDCSPDLKTHISNEAPKFLRSLNSCIERSNRIFRYGLFDPQIQNTRKRTKKRPLLKLKPPVCDQDHDHIFITETFKTLEAAHQFMIDSGLRTLYRTRSSNSVGALYVCKRTMRREENDGDKNNSLSLTTTKKRCCGVKIKICTKLISRKAGDRFFIVKGCLNHNHDIRDARLSPRIFNLMTNPSKKGSKIDNEGENEVKVNAVDDDDDDDDDEGENEEIVIQYDNETGVYITNKEMEPQFIQEVTLDHAYSIEQHQTSESKGTENVIYKIYTCERCDKVFFEPELLENHECNASNKSNFESQCSNSKHVHELIDRDFTSMEAALSYVENHDLRIYFTEQIKRKDFIVFQCSKGVHPDKITVKNETCPASFTIKASIPFSKFTIQGCLTHNHETAPQLLRYLTRSLKRSHFSLDEETTFENEIEEFQARKEHALTLLMNTIKYIMSLGHSAENDKVLNAIIKSNVNAINPRMLMGDLDSIKRNHKS